MSRLTTTEIGHMIARGTTEIRADIAEVRTDIAGLKDDIASIKSMLMNSNPVSAEKEMVLACPHCGRALTKGEIEFCEMNGIDSSCYSCRNSNKPRHKVQKKITMEEATTKIKYVGRCKHEFHYTKPTYKKYINRCRELGVPILLCPTCAKQFLDNKTVQLQADSNGANQGF